MNVTKWLDKVAYIKNNGTESHEYRSIFDDSYITHVGMEDQVKHLAKLEITKELTHGVGFSPLDGKWYGWSHRAIYGFKVGSTCEKGDSHYRAVDSTDTEQDVIDFWSDSAILNVRCDGVVEKDGQKYYDIKWEYDNNLTLPPNTGNKRGGVLHYVEKPGRGKWVAKTMADAKEMAQDFNSSVS